MFSNKGAEYIFIKEVTLLTALLTIFFVFASYISGNMEFVYYSLVMLPFLAFLYFEHERLHITAPVFILGFIFAFLHIAGGAIGLYKSGVFGIGYDTITHTYGAFIMALIAYDFIRAHWRDTKEIGDFYLFLVILLVGLGVGSLVEIIEFGAVLAFNITGVGGYYNNAMDQVRNLVGAAIGAILMIYVHHKK